MSIGVLGSRQFRLVPKNSVSRLIAKFHTEGVSQYSIHYPLPWFESDEGRYAVNGGLSAYLKDRPELAIYNINRRLRGVLGTT